jgi:hypothetical protein
LVSYQQTSRDADGRVRGQFISHGVKPAFFARLAASGFGDVDETYFAKGVDLPVEEPPEPATDELAPVVPPSEPPELDIQTERAPVRPAAQPLATLFKPEAPRTPPPPLRKPEAEPRTSESSIELDPELQREIEARLSDESTLITRNPLERGRDDDTQPGTRRRP